MFDFFLLKDEEVEIISNETILKTEDDARLVSSIITSKRLILLDSPKDLENFRVGKEIFPSVKKEVILEILLDDIKNIIDGEEFDTYQLMDGKNLFLADLQVKNYIKAVKNAG